LTWVGVIVPLFYASRSDDAEAGVLFKCWMV